MRGQENTQASMFSYVSLEQRVPKDHPLRTLRALVDGILANMSALFDQRYSHTGRPSIPPEQLLRALLVQILFTIRSERQLVEQLDYNLLFRWFVGLGMDDAVWDRTVFSINRDRLLGTDVARQFFRRVLHLAEWQGFVSDEHFSVDGTMIEAWASHKSFVPKDGSGPDKPAGRNPEVDFSGPVHKVWVDEKEEIHADTVTGQACRAQPGGGLQGQDAQQRHTPEHDRPAGAALQEGRVCGSEAALHGACALREPQRARRRCGEHAGYGALGVGGGDPDDRPERAQAGRDGGCGQGL